MRPTAGLVTWVPIVNNRANTFMAGYANVLVLVNSLRPSTWFVDLRNRWRNAKWGSVRHALVMSNPVIASGKQFTERPRKAAPTPELAARGSACVGDKASDIQDLGDSHR